MKNFILTAAFLTALTANADTQVDYVRCRITNIQAPDGSDYIMTAAECNLYGGQATVTVNSGDSICCGLKNNKANECRPQTLLKDCLASGGVHRY